MKDKRFESLKSIDVIIVLVYFFFVFLQYNRISNLNLSYLGEEVSFNIVPYYTAMLLLIPETVFVSVYLPGLCIIQIETRMINFYSLDIKCDHPRNQWLSASNYSITSVFEKSYRVLRC